MDIVVLASGNGSTFQAIIDNCEHVNIKALISNSSNAHAVRRAKDHNILYAIGPNLMMSTMVSYFKPQLVVLAGYMRILTSGFIQRYPNTVNIHPSLLPKYKGLATYGRVLAAGDTEHGTTIHWVVDELDAGLIIAQESFSVQQADTVQTLMDKTKEIEQELYPKVLDKIATGMISLPSS